MFRDKATRHSIREVLQDRAGSIAEGLGGIVLIVMIIGSLAFGVTSNMQAVTAVATKAERQATISSLVGDQHSVPDWGTPEDPNTDTVTLPNGHEVEITTWREVTPVSVRLTAVSPISADIDAADCSGPSDIAKKGCIYSSRLHANDIDGITPRIILRKDPSMGSTPPVGTVDPRVSTANPIPQGYSIAFGKDAEATVWRYLVEAEGIEAGAEIEIRQGSKILAKFPVDTDMTNYFGTITVTPGSNVVASVTAGNIIIKSVLFYRAGSTS